MFPSLMTFNSYRSLLSVEGNDSDDIKSYIYPRFTLSSPYVVKNVFQTAFYTALECNSSYVNDTDIVY